ncbi:hypothetical protein FHG64_11030 [Antarcticibacterium flavum]|uniref:SnoaL-like domain-containing protein n=1 Tax=Antarcticibacterium flavum TaxID=2058175 RepID=A0A5B7X3G4_9FLAO|nr:MULTISPECIES: nuclear transport factor 2 family protein [Antarcticibacterium]MCM4159475.1 hypothetical protein [Antarcticibacterium sp. W02-3]QCY69889.1 hypothetical protein FHG64_11030 [Antarcticibacterium flavum]
MKTIRVLLLLLTITGCEFKAQTNIETIDPESAKDSINLLLNDWHAAAGQANYEGYFNLMAGDGVFIGTDATENWQNEEFRSFAKPYFDRGTAWSFSALERNIYFSAEGDIAWFDELLDTQMGICRGSGVLENTAEGWKIKHYVLSIAIPNENVEEVTELKRDFDRALIEDLRQ